MEKYLKQALPLEKQADKILAQGLIADREELIKYLQTLSYYRLSGYLRFFKNSDKTYITGTKLDNIIDLYEFDKKLRFSLFAAISNIEIYLRAYLANKFALDHGPFAYLDPKSLPKLAPEKFKIWCNKLKEQIDRSRKHKEDFIMHFYSKYDEEIPPIWMVTEIIDFGSVLYVFEGLSTSLKKELAQKIGIHYSVLLSWLRALNTARNRCAHHSRVWNSRVGIAPALPQIIDGNPDSRFAPYTSFPNKIGVIFAMCKFMLDRIEHEPSTWGEDTLVLLKQRSQRELGLMGFPVNWDESIIWTAKN